MPSGRPMNPLHQPLSLVFNRGVLVQRPRRLRFSLLSLACATWGSVGCLASTSAPASGGSSGSGAASGANAPSGTGGATGSGAATGANAATGASGGSAGAAPGTMLVPISPDLNGFVGANTNSVGIQGSWYGYGDGWGS